MDEPSNIERARSFDLVVDAYDRGRPSYPEDAARWLVDRQHAHVLEVGAGTGKLTEQLVALGHTVTATDPSESMLLRLGERVPQARAVRGAAERIPVAARSADAVVAAASFHWFETDQVLPEIARVLDSGGSLGLVWNVLDERIPWVRRLAAIIGEHTGGGPDPVQVIDDSGLFETVQTATFRFWQPLTRQSLQELVLSRSNVAVMSQEEREPVLRKVDELYDEYGRGHDGMLLPYVTHAYRAVVLPWAAREHDDSGASASADRPDDLGTDSLLIDFR